jgi:hypothetical protein
MKTTFLLVSLIFTLNLPVFAVTPLTESTFTEIIREANVVAATDKSIVTARTNMIFHAPDRVRTGAASRVEMTAPDKTITRIGANTVFTFAEGERNIILEKGSILFHAPSGVGGGTIQYHGTAAAVLGTTMICAVLPNGAFKIMDLEGEVKVSLKSGADIVLQAGQMVVIPADGKTFHKVEVFEIGKVIARLVLIVGFSNPLSSLPLIEAAANKQNQQISDGTIKIVAPADEVVFGLDIFFPLPTVGIPTPPHTPDFTTVPISPFLP